jgi:hypothetical protein
MGSFITGIGVLIFIGVFVEAVVAKRAQHENLHVTTLFHLNSKRFFRRMTRHITWIKVLNPATRKVVVYPVDKLPFTSRQNSNILFLVHKPNNRFKMYTRVPGSRLALNLGLLLDAPLKWQATFQQPATAVMQAIIEFHYTLMFYLIVILVFVVTLLARVVYLFREGSAITLYKLRNHNYYQKLTHNTPLEVVWTVVPACLLVLILIPSLALLQLIEETYVPQ